jgi:hypothetical protein
MIFVDSVKRVLFQEIRRERGKMQSSFKLYYQEGMQQNVLMVLSSEFLLALIVQFSRWTYATLELNQQL